MTKLLFTLFNGGKSLGSKTKQGEDLHVQWQVKYEPGVLKAVSKKNGKVVLVKETKTAGKPAKIELVADRSNIAANGIDLSFVTVRILDEQGNLVPDADNMVQFKLEGEGSIAGVDNGFQASLEPFKADYRKAYRGLCLAIIQAKKKVGKLELRATASGLEAASLTITVK